MSDYSTSNPEHAAPVICGECNEHVPVYIFYPYPEPKPEDVPSGYTLADYSIGSADDHYCKDCIESFKRKDWWSIDD